MLKDQLDDYLPTELQEEVKSEEGVGSVETYKYKGIDMDNVRNKLGGLLKLHRN